MKTYAICLVGLEHRPAIVVGGGSIAARKVSALVAAGAPVTVISPELSPEIQAQADAGAIQVCLRAYRPGDLAQAGLVIAATDDPEANQAVWQEAMQRGILINVVDDPQHCNFILPAVLQRGDLTVAVSTGGASPALARRLREQLEALIGPEYADLTAILSELRPEIMEAFPAGPARQAAALRLVDANLVEVIRNHGYQVARQQARDILKAASGEA